MEHGPDKEQMVRRQAAQNRTPLPRWVLEKPGVPFGLESYFKAFMTLSSCRSAGMEEGRIPWTAAREYARAHRMDGQEERELWEIVAGLDLAYLRVRAEKAKTEADRKNKRLPSPGRK